MRLSTKHSNQQIVEYRDFSGGLNTSNASEMIAHNELARAINVEIDKPTGLIRTVAGTRTLYQKEGAYFTDIAYDKIGDMFVVCDIDKKIYVWKEPDLSEAIEAKWIDQKAKYLLNIWKESDLQEIGTLTGNLTPSFCLWEDGLLIASGGALQYFKNGEVHTISETSLVKCNGVFVRGGRVWTYSGDTLYTSAVGDEESWVSDPADASTAQWITIGYKDGGEIVGVVSLSSDVLIVKDNGHVFRLSGEYPDWTVKEVSREVTCRGYRASVGIINNAVILGDSFMQTISTTEDYGDMHATDISAKVKNEIAALPKKVKLRYVAPYNQIWLVDGDRRFLFLELDNNAYFEREYTTALMDVCYKGNKVFALKKDKIQILDSDSEFDEDDFLKWRWRAKTLVSNNAYVVKRGRADITPIIDHYHECVFVIGKAELHGSFQNLSHCLYEDYSPLYYNKRELFTPPINAEYLSSDELFLNSEYLFENETKLFSLNQFRTDDRFIERLRSVKVESYGQGGQLIFNGINFEIAEV
ncbi:MAG: hypothetical protein J6M62_03610 [Selenomonadaceae bacterium]|nr:hypothetical protein [Selenomonadaceae bacterium]MBO6304153.1 hypothetical protein [Selenomonadaceae bacterium]